MCERVPVLNRPAVLVLSVPLASAPSPPDHMSSHGGALEGLAHQKRGIKCSRVIQGFHIWSPRLTCWDGLWWWGSSRRPIEHTLLTSTFMLGTLLVTETTLRRSPEWDVSVRVDILQRYLEPEHHFVPDLFSGPPRSSRAEDSTSSDWRTLIGQREMSIMRKST